MSERVLYLHGLGSSGNSSTVAALRDLDLVVDAPSYAPHDYERSMRELCDTVNSVKPSVIVGTSMGGFYAMKLSEVFGLPTLAINPVLDHATFLEIFRDRPAKDYATNTDIPISDTMRAAFEPLDRIRRVELAAPIHVIVGMNDEVVNPHSTIAYCESENLVYTPLPWGHRVENAEVVANLVGFLSIPAL